MKFYLFLIFMLISSIIEVVPMDSISGDRQFLSPDRRFSIQEVYKNRDDWFLITDQTTGLSISLLNEYSPIHSLLWSSDSKTIVVVGQASATTLLQVLHLDGKQWKVFMIDAPIKGENNRFLVKHWKFNDAQIDATYIVNRQDEGGKTLGLYESSFKIDPSNGHISDIFNKLITRKEFIMLRKNSSS